VKIDHGIPMPEGNRQAHGKMAEARIALASMAIGDSLPYRARVNANASMKRRWTSRQR